MKRLLCVVLLAVTGIAAADDLADANRLLAAKDFGKALPLYQRLAEVGNAEAQFRLGEMYWFGDGTSTNLGKAAQWLQKSADAGNADAAASLASLKRRASHGNEIEYWTKTYQGEDLVSGKFACEMPSLPTGSQTIGDATVVQASIVEWRTCYNGFVENMNAALPAGKAIPAATLDMMTPAEARLAQRHLDQVYSRIIADAQRDAKVLAAREDAWLKQTVETYQRSAALDSAIAAAGRLRYEAHYREPNTMGERVTQSSR